MIQSNLDTAQQIATALNSAVTKIQGTSRNSVTSDNSSNIAVVGKASDITSALVDIVQQYQVGLKQMMTDIHSVAKSFESTDQELSKHFYQLSNQDIAKDRATYNLALKR